MYRYMLFLLLLFPVVAFGQISITGKVNDVTTKKGVENASVILSNTANGSKTAADGSFNLQNVKPGQYDLVVSIIGYETYHQTITALNANLPLAAIELLPKSITLHEVNIKPDPNWVRNYEVFKEEFLGSAPAAKMCKILNPEVIDLQYDANEKTLSATSDVFIEVENKALGYKVKYLLSHFTKDYEKGMLYYEGAVLFENLQASTAQKKRRQKARDKAYYGSLAHFLKSSLHQQSAEQGFKTLRLIRKPNTQRPPEELIQTKFVQFRKSLPASWAMDSISKWSKQKQLPKILSYLVKTPLNTSLLISRTDQKGTYALSYSDCLYIMYTGTHDTSTNQLSFHPPDMPNYQTTIVNFASKYAFFDDNGTVLNPTAMIFEGYWGTSRVSGLLPVDFEPATGK
jgi:hypothetical protein